MMLFVPLLAQVSSTAVIADTQSLFDETVVVRNLSFFTITRSIDISGKTNVKIQGSIDVVSGGGSISVYVMDADGYQQFQKSREARKAALYTADDVVSQTLSVPIATSGTYHVVLDNEKSLLTSKTVRVQLTLSYDAEFLNTTLLYAIAGVVVVLVAAGLAFAFMRSRRKGPAGGSTAASAATVEISRKHCGFCGAIMHELAKICPACGKQQA